jgi:hypothetical protein
MGTIAMPAAADFGSDEQTAYLALKGVREVVLDVTGFAPDFEPSGLRGTEIRQAVAAQLQSGGINVVDESVASQSPAAAVLHVELHADRTMYGPYSYAARLQLDQKIPIGSAGGFVSEKVWSQGTTGWVTPGELHRVNGEVRSLVQSFLAEHSLQNGATAAR